MKTINSQQEEYKEFLKNIRQEREQSSSFMKFVITLVMALLCSIIVCVILVENNLFLNKLSSANSDDLVGTFKISRKQKKNFIFRRVNFIYE